jgi:signal-transduction protein with cAMP-binding, CBS, and nucleotidyltransferase domain
MARRFQYWGYRAGRRVPQQEGKMKIGEFMTTRIEYIDAGNSVYDAVEILVDKRIRSVVVRNTGGENDYGVVTARDVVFKVLAKGLNPKEVKVSQIASGPLVCMSADTEFDEVALIMEKNKIARVYVCEQGKILGLVSLLDLMSAELIMRARGENVS